MNTRKRHRLAEDTVSRLNVSKNGFTWRGLAVFLGYKEKYAGTLHKVAEGQDGSLTSEAENILRVRLGLSPVSTVEVPPCPDCGAAHTGRCHNKPVVQVVVLTEGECVTQAKVASKPRKRKPRTTIELPPDIGGTLNAERLAAGQTWAEYIEQLAIDARTLRAMEHNA